MADFKVGDTVRLRADVKEPEFGWPSTIPRDGAFEVIEVMNFAVSVKLPQRKGHWDIAIDEIELAPPQPDPRDAEIERLRSRVAELESRQADEDRGTATAGYGGTATAGDRGTATAGDRGTATAGDRGTATAGYGGTATAGDRGVIVVWRIVGGNRRPVVGAIGETLDADGNVLEARQPYRLNDDGKWVKAPK